MKNRFNFSIETTNCIKGIALLLMFTSHLFAFPDWLVSGNKFISIPFCNYTLAYWSGKFGGICVGIFMFLTGYGMYYSYLKGNCFIKSGKKSVNFLLKYWILIFTFFLPIELLMGRTYFNPAKWHLELFGIYTSIIGFAWYVRFYVLTMITLPFLKNIIIRTNVWGSIIVSIVPFQIIYIILNILSTQITFHNAESITKEYFEYITIVLLGYCFAKFELYGKLSELLSKYHFNNFIVYLFGILFVVIMRVKILPESGAYIPNMDILYVPIFLFFLIEILNHFHFKPLLRCLSIIGNNSLNLWFLQSVFFFETKKLQWVVYLPKLSIVVLIWNIIILLPVAKLYNIIYKRIHIM